MSVPPLTIGASNGPLDQEPPVTNANAASGNTPTGIDTVRNDLAHGFARPPLPEGCPYTVEYVDTRLRRPGLKIIGELPAKDYFAELTQGDAPFVNQALLEKFGFIIFENCLGHEDGQWLKDKRVQLPHHDVGTE